MGRAHHIPRAPRKRGAPADDAQGATILHLPSPEVRRALEDIAIVGALAIEAYRRDDRELLGQTERWHAREQAVIDRARAEGYLAREAVRG